MKFSLIVEEGNAVLELKAETESEKQLFGLLGDYEAVQITRVRGTYDSYDKPPAGLKVYLQKPTPAEPFTHPLQMVTGG